MPDETTVTAQTTAANDGRSTGGIWINSDSEGTIATDIYLGLRFTGLPYVEPSSGYGHPTVLYRTITLGLTLTTSAGSDSTARVYMVNEVDPAAFSDSRLPGDGSLDEIPVSDLITIPAGTSLGEFPLPLNMGPSTTVPLGPGIPNIYNRTGFLGAMAFVILLDPGSILTVRFANGGNPATFTGLGQPFDSGLVGLRPGERAAMDERTGQFTSEDNLTEDGYHQGLRVLPENRDPRRPERPRVPPRRRAREDWR